MWTRVQALTERVEALAFSGRAERIAEVSRWSLPVEEEARDKTTTPTSSEPEYEASPGPELLPALVRLTEPALPEAPAPVAPEIHVPVASGQSEPADRGGFEEVFGRRLPIWAGGATLAVAGFLVVRYSIEVGLLSPLVRVLVGLLFESALIGAAEAALRREDAVGDPRVRQALAGAGAATLYGCVLAAANLYGLVGPATAFVGLALVTALTAALSVRFGAPSAVLGLVGGLAAPALVGASQPNVPLLTLYLALAVGGLCALGRQQRWWWLGASAIAGGLGWGAVLIAGGVLGIADTVAVGFYTLALGVALPLLVAGSHGGAVRLAGGLVGCAQLAALVALGGFAPLHWALFGLLSVALMWLSRREPPLADSPILALGVAVLLMLAWPAPTMGELAPVLGAAAAIFGVPTVRRVWRDEWRQTDAPMLGLLALATGLVPMVHGDGSGLPALIGSVGLAVVAARGWCVEDRGADARFATLTLPAALLLAVAGLWTLPDWSWAPFVALVALGLHHIAQQAANPRVERGGWAFTAAVLASLAGDRGTWRLAGFGEPDGMTALLTWAVPAAAFAMAAFNRRASKVVRRAAQGVAALIGYGAAAQVVPALWLPLVPAALLFALAAVRRADTTPALFAAGLVSAGWAAAPFAQWSLHALLAASGAFVAIGGWPTFVDAGSRLALPAAALLLAARALPAARRRAVCVAGSVGLLVALHLGVVHLFAIDTPARFATLSSAERFCWELLLAGLAAVAWKRGLASAAVALGVAALAHLAWFAGVVANPLLVEQTPGPWLALSYALGGALLWASPRAVPEWRRARDRAAMVLAVVAAFTLLRQASHAPMILSDGTDRGEQIARSLVALALAGGFLWTGIRRQAREWRLASLALMLAAVAQVFLHDAAGLDGLARIASFAALGFSLIGVGWLHSHYLPAQDHS